MLREISSGPGASLIPVTKDTPGNQETRKPENQETRKPPCLEASPVQHPHNQHHHHHQSPDGQGQPANKGPRKGSLSPTFLAPVFLSAVAAGNKAVLSGGPSRTDQPGRLVAGEPYVKYVKVPWYKTSWPFVLHAIHDRQTVHLWDLRPQDKEEEDGELIGGGKTA